MSLKKRLCLPILLAAILLCGCGKAEDRTEPTAGYTENEPPAAVTSENYETETSDSEAQIHKAVDPSDNEYKPVPKEWLPVYTAEEAIDRFDEIMGADLSNADISEVILNLVNRNALAFEVINCCGWYEIDWDSPVKSEQLDRTVYPVISECFTDYETVQGLFSGTYTDSLSEQLLMGGAADDRKPCFEDIDGRLYVDPTVLGKWVHDTFKQQSYVKVINVTDDLCEFVWYYPDFEGLNPPLEGMEYFYYENHYFAENVDGKWLLNEFINDG